MTYFLTLHSKKMARSKNWALSNILGVLTLHLLANVVLINARHFMGELSEFLPDMLEKTAPRVANKPIVLSFFDLVELSEC
jgi:hypothetical protein